ncbi:MAG: hypothetical protein ACUVRE_05655 [Thermoanaerobaculaceae bacterium]
MTRRWPAALLSLLGLLVAALFFHDQGKARAQVDLEMSQSLAKAALSAVDFVPAGEVRTSLRYQRILVWAWERACWEAGRASGLFPSVVISWDDHAEVVLRGWEVVELRRPIEGNPGPHLPTVLLEDHIRHQLQPIFPELASFSLQRLVSRTLEGVVWQRAYFARSGPPLPKGWREELMVELSGSTVALVKRTLVPEPSDMGVVMGRWAELSRITWLAFFAVGLVVAGLGLAALERLYFRLHLPWFSAVFLGLAVWFLGRELSHNRALILFWALGSGLSLLLARNQAGGKPSPWPWCLVLGVVLACWSLAWWELVVLFGGWAPRFGYILGGDWAQTLGEAVFRALSEEPVFRGGLLWLVSPFLGRGGAGFVAAFLGSLLHLLPAVPQPSAFLGELVAQMGLSFSAWRWGWFAAVLIRVTWETLRLGVAAPLFPWQVIWPSVILLAALGVAWAGFRR